jgi:hypothetical protein
VVCVNSLLSQKTASWVGLLLFTPSLPGVGAQQLVLPAGRAAGTAGTVPRHGCDFSDSLLFQRSINGSAYSSTSVNLRASAIPSVLC